MKFQITNGLGIVSMGLSEIGSYFSFKKPLSVVWWDCRGSVGKYLCTLPYSEEYRAEVRKQIVDNLHWDDESKTEELYEIIQPLLRIFPNGTYALNFYNSRNRKFFTSESPVFDGLNVPPFYGSCMFSEVSDVLKQEETVAAHEIFIKKNEKINTHYSPNLLEYTTGNFYDEGNYSMIATQPKSEIDPERVKYFEDLISKGGRPFILIFNCKYFENETSPEDHYSLRSEDFVLDGHHKLLAYHNLKIYPAILEITHLAYTRKDVEFNLEKLIEVMFPWQVEHIYNNWDEKRLYISEFVKNPSSKIHLFYKNGHIRKFHRNGKLKYEAFYIDDKVEGPEKSWFDNGELEFEQFYTNGFRTGTWKSWFPSGQLRFVQPYNHKGNIDGRMVSYYISGKVWWEQTMKDAMPADGYSYNVWNENGTKQAELKYLNGQMIERKNYNEKGVLVSFEEWDVRK